MNDKTQTNVVYHFGPHASQTFHKEGNNSLDLEVEAAFFTSPSLMLLFSGVIRPVVITSLEGSRFSKKKGSFSLLLNRAGSSRSATTIHIWYFKATLQFIDFIAHLSTSQTSTSNYILYYLFY